MKIYTLSLIFFLGFSSAIYSQNTKERVRQLFPEADAVEWVYFFRGRMNDMNDVVLTLGSDGKAYKGFFKYLRSGEELLLEGEVAGEELALSEKDTLGNVTGYILGTIKPLEGINGKWFSADRTIGATLELTVLMREPEFPTYCGDNKWIRTYNGLIGEEDVTVILEQGSNFNISGLAYFEKQNKSYKVEGEWVAETRAVSLMLKDNNWEKRGKVTGKIDFQTDNITGDFEDETGRNFIVGLVKGEVLSVGCLEFADFISKMEVTYPKTRSNKFNEMLNSYIKDWQQASRAYTRQYRQQMPVLKPEMRAALRSYLWCDVEYFSTTIISGKATHTNTWEDEYVSYAFNFDFVNNQSIQLQDLFENGSNYEEFIQKYILKSMSQRPFAEEVDFKEWLTTATFPYFTIRREGINFFSNFNSLYGAQNCTISYSILASFLKKDSPISSLLRQD